MNRVISALLLFGLILSSPALANPQYSLETICQTYGKVGKCKAVDFCREHNFQQGCYLASGAPAFMENLCTMQRQKFGCDILQQQGNCVWVENNSTSCHAKFHSF